MVKHFSAHTSCCFRDLHSALPQEQTPCRAQPQHPSAERHLQPSKDPARLQGVYPWRLKYVKANRASCPSRCLHGTCHKNSTTSTIWELPKPMMQRRFPLDGRGPQARPKVSCSKHGVVLLWNSLPKLRSPRDRRTTAQNVFRPPPASPVPICATAGAPARSAAGPGREQGTCTSEASGFKTGQNKALRHHAKVLNYRLQLSGTLHPFSTKPTTAEKPLEMEERLAYGRKGFINSI